jgi:D-arabinose 1-dehydrogenase-like Zn-dependent alcohol dehydrogenase
MKAMVLNRPGTPLEWTELPDRQPGAGEVRVKVLACGVCRTDLHVLDRELPNPNHRSSPDTRSLAGSTRSARASRA